MGVAILESGVGRRRGGRAAARPAVRRGAKCAFPEGAVPVFVTRGNPISEEALATLPPRRGGDFTGERAVWEGKFYTL